MKLWVDKNHEPPADYIWARTLNEVDAAIMFHEHQCPDDTVIIDMEPEIGMALIDWYRRYNIVDTGYFFYVHGAQPKRENLEFLIKNYGWRLI